jgi:DNA-binding protein HU-beta
MHRIDLVNALITTTQLEKKAIEKTVDVLLKVFTDTLAAGEEIRMSGFGAFKVAERKARQARNPRTGESIQVPASKTVTFRPSKDLKDKLNGSSSKA